MRCGKGEENEIEKEQRHGLPAKLFCKEIKNNSRTRLGLKRPPHFEEATRTSSASGASDDQLEGIEHEKVKTQQTSLLFE